MEKRNKDDMVIRKGPWMAEEDEILKDYVKKYGPRDWSSIRSKGLLPRTGKSCRLRWVNKLKPDLKTGCKFSADEERVVIDLQAKFGNKWARIATYLPGRTDNDVKNFWSTRQKRLGRIRQASPLPNKSQRKIEKTSVPTEAHILEAPNFSVVSMGDESSSSDRSGSHPKVENFDGTNMQPIPEMANPDFHHLETNLPLLDYMTIEPIEKKPFDPLPQFPFPQLPEDSMDIPLMPEGQDLITGLSDTNFLGAFPQGLHFPVGMPYFGFDGTGPISGKHERDNPVMPENCFDDFPVDMFDYLEQVPSSSGR
ncbi:transcription factor DUO1 [Macadamia integrifolia]|uniref:transcription factor DUO1 n=1 Tax=Macadamia integrifolia TaxID=60698 RepID=UPI001C52D261|nr:transcription factor DUO1 [Macadamia integrifolia]